MPDDSDRERRSAGGDAPGARTGRYAPLPPPVEPLPRHIAFIMDGNGRWARQRGFRRLRGHRLGAESLRRITRYCARIGVDEITFYALSTENYTRRPRAEIEFLMKLLEEFLVGERDELRDGNIRLRAIGRTDELPARVRNELARSLELTASHTGLIMRLALNYGSRVEIADGVRRLLGEAAAGRLSASEIDSFDGDSLRRWLYDPEMSDPDLVVRTGGEARLSNFLLWQASYAELWVTDVLWPDFDVPDLEAALAFFAKRERKYGGLEGLGSRRARDRAPDVVRDSIGKAE